MGRIEQYKQDDLKRISHNTPMASDCGTLAALTDTNWGAKSKSRLEANSMVVPSSAANASKNVTSQENNQKPRGFSLIKIDELIS